MTYVYILLLILAAAPGILGLLPKKRVIVTPVSKTGQISQQSILVEKSYLDRLLDSTPVKAIQHTFTAIGFVTVLFWIF